MARRAPAAVATPFPPLNLRKIVQTCPENVPRSATHRTRSGLEKLNLFAIISAHITGKKPFRKSRAKQR